MPHRAVTALAGILQPRVILSKSRLETLRLLVVGMISARTVDLGRIACERPGSVLIASACRRLQRFFQHVALPRDWALPLLADLPALRGPQTLVLDRTQWAIGAREVNHLVLAVVTRRFRVPLLWTLSPRGGDSHATARIAPIERYLARFPASSIRPLVADREFVGAEWLKFLNDNSAPFAIRPREDRFAEGEPPVRRVVTRDGCELTLFACLRGRRQTRTFQARLGADGAANGPLLDFAARPLKDERLIVVSSVPPRTALAACRKRWAIERLFGDAETRGLNIEDTRLTCFRKLDLLMSLVALAFAWAGHAASDVLGTREPPRRAHGRLAQSWFGTGFDQVRNRLGTNPETAIAAWCAPQKPPKGKGVA